jgi:hypothetical protein
MTAELEAIGVNPVLGEMVKVVKEVAVTVSVDVIVVTVTSPHLANW